METHLWLVWELNCLIYTGAETAIEEMKTTAKGGDDSRDTQNSLDKNKNIFEKMSEYRISSNRPRPSNRARRRASSEVERALEYTAQDVIMYTCTTVVTTNLNTLRWHLFVQPVLIRNRARPRIQRALDYSAQFGQVEINWSIRGNTVCRILTPTHILTELAAGRVYTATLCTRL